MSVILSKKKFLEVCREVERPWQGHQYLVRAQRRLYDTYRLASSLCADGMNILSIGAGSAYVEGCLKKYYDITISVVDFEGVIEKCHDLYSELALQAIPHDLSQSHWNFSQQKYDIVFTCDIIEHIPQPPLHHISKITTLLKSDGHIILTTDNLGSLKTIMKLLHKRPIFAPPEKFFSTVSMDNEEVHRREYLAWEITDAMYKASLSDVNVQYTWQGITSLEKSLLAVPEFIIPSLRPHMLIHARKP